ncbi:AcrR family transcriptional regulator [Pullulanibacillus pueri]|uniref:TetR family transcriptional regulator n=1 Tax=Pullulanibacillus pueri TaxID=1437324 RepID=A0A8J2ZYI6_9BACL|nr:TetR/AcrR family transcriptional regulator [Pullulanibacillus pueri]MBM7683100.1 AcrR family transcriptional regulator [Pullulanibacillus pueri]GGH85283.1 TetR family transcriptional regulator [Pullulanibacillus pueri]
MSEKKEKLLRVAERLFYQNGFHAIGLKRIISESDIAIMTLYNHFASKDDLIVEVLKRREQQYKKYLRRYLSDDKRLTLLNLAKGHADWLAEHQQCGCMFLRAKEEFGSDPDHPVVQLVNNHKESMVRLIQNMDETITDEDALQFTLLLEGATALSETTDPKVVGQQLLTMTNRVFLDS